jgi:hypothetical protein
VIVVQKKLTVENVVHVQMGVVQEKGHARLILQILDHVVQEDVQALKQGHASLTVLGEVMEHAVVMATHAGIVVHVQAEVVQDKDAPQETHKTAIQ